MSYYIVSENDGLILETQDSMSDSEIQESADYFGCDVYAIRGEHSGYSAVCSEPVSSPAPPEVAQARADITALPDGIAADEGQRAYTEAEVQELLAQERERVVQALGLRGLIGAGLVDGILAELSEVKHA